jgi:nitrogen regulatory protein PII
MEFKHEVIFCVVNAGFSESVMDAAKEFGARGGTVIHARGTANSEAERLFGITVQPEKEIVMILVPSEIKDDILHALYRAVGLKTPGQGIAFSMPVDAAVGLWNGDDTKKEKKSENAPATEEKSRHAPAGK